MRTATRRASALSAVVLLALASVLAVGAGAASAQPGTITVISGTVAQSTSGSTLTLTQSTDVAIISTNISADVAAGETLRIVQPSATSVLVIRDLGSGPSTFAGTIVSTGSVVLINPLGLSFAATADVQVGGDLLVTSGDATDAQFIGGGVVDFTLTDAGGPIEIAAGASVVSQGTLLLLSPSVSNAGTTGSTDSRYYAIAYEQTTWDPHNRNSWSFSNPLFGASYSFTGTQLGVIGITILGYGPSTLSGDTVVTAQLLYDGYYADARIGGDPIDSPTGFRVMAVGPDGDETSSGARALLGDPVHVSMTGVNVTVGGTGAVPNFASVRVQEFELLDRFAADYLTTWCQVGETSGAIEPYFEIQVPTIDGADFLPADFDASIPNQAPLTVPGFGTVTLNQQVASQLDGYDVVTTTAVHIVTEEGDDVRLGETTCGIPQAVTPAGPQLAATGGELPVGAFGAAIIAVLAGLALVARRRVTR